MKTWYNIPVNPIQPINMSKEYMANVMKEKSFDCELKYDFNATPELWRCKLVKRAGTDAKPTHIAFWKKGQPRNKSYVTYDSVSVLGVLEHAIGIKFQYGNTPHIGTIKIK